MISFVSSAGVYPGEALADPGSSSLPYKTLLRKENFSEVDVRRVPLSSDLVILVWPDVVIVKFCVPFQTTPIASRDNETRRP